MDPAKLKVVDLRNELASRGLDQKGNKAVLVKRLKDALEKESGDALPDTSIADTTTEDIDTSVSEDTPRKSLRKSADEREEAKTIKGAPSTEKSKLPVKPTEKEQTSQLKSPSKPLQSKPPEAPKAAVTSPSKSVPAKAATTSSSSKPVISTSLNKPVTASPSKPVTASPAKPVTTSPAKPVTTSPAKPVTTSPAKPLTTSSAKPGTAPPASNKQASPAKPVATAAVNKQTTNSSQVKSSPTKVPEVVKTEVKQSANAAVDNIKTGSKSPEKTVKTPQKDKEETESSEKAQLSNKSNESNGEEVTKETSMEVQESVNTEKSEVSEEKREKRKRSNDSPERPSKRQKSPPREDEPIVNAEAVQLSWYDSDLHLLVDKSTFLSAKPLTEGAFGYTWAGARATYGVTSGKVCYEVKITEKLEWTDFSRPSESSRDDRRYQRRDDRRDDRRHSKKSDRDSKQDETGKSKGKSEKSGKDETEKKENGPGEKESGSESKEESMEVTDSAKDEVKETEADEPMETEKSDGEKKEGEENNEENKKEEKMEDDEKKEKENDEENKDEKKEKGNDEESKDKKKPEGPPLPTHFFRIGWSLLSTSLQLGEDEHSFAYESTGKFVKNKEFVDYGVSFDTDAVIGAYLDISENTVSFRFSVNGELQPATEIPKTEFPDDFVLYPHILSRNYSFEVNFGDKEEPLFTIPAELVDYTFISKAENKVPGLDRPENRSDCEVLLMWGLPASGKTHWVNEHVAANPDKNYTIIGNTSMLERMTISGEPLKSKFVGKWGILIDKVQKCLNKLITTAAMRRRNYIIDQTNVFASAQRRKMRPFEGFKRKAVIVVVGDEEQTRRQILQEKQEGKEVPDNIILGMKASMALPETGDWLEEMLYVGLEEEEVKELIKKYNEAGKAAGFGQERRYGRDNKWSHNRNNRGGRDFRRSGGRDGGRSDGDSRYRQSYSQDRRGWQPSSRREGGGGWKQESRSRDWRGGDYDQRSRDYRSQGSYDRNRSGSRPGGNWGGNSGGNWGSRNQGSSGWNQQTFGRNFNQVWGNSGGGQGWNRQGSGSSQGHGNWNNYYGQQQGSWQK